RGEPFRPPGYALPKAAWLHTLPARFSIKIFLLAQNNFTRRNASWQEAHTPISAKFQQKL
ncbi:MAG: hypothetical protein LUC89_01505, partial [Oscillospiraceae bacterium]|nr:hypothetical protein [Oscillospiraceae bacterium]